MKKNKYIYASILFSAVLLCSCGDSENSKTAETPKETAAVTEKSDITSEATTVSETTAAANSETAETSESSVTEVSQASSETVSAVSEPVTEAAASASPSQDNTQNNSGQNQSPAESAPSDSPSEDPVPESNEVTINLNGSSAECSSSKVSINGSEITITADGVYKLYGSLDGKLIVSAPKDAAVDIELNNVNISCGNGPAIQIESADKVKIISAAGSDNTLSDGGSSEGCIYSKEDVTLKGDGTVRIHGNVKNAVYSKNTLKITGGTFDISSQNNGLTGKDKVIIENGNVTLNCVRDGIKSTNEKEAGKGTVAVTGGTVYIEAGDDAIQAVSGVTVSGCSVTVKCEGKKINCDAENSVDEGCITKIK